MNTENPACVRREGLWTVRHPLPTGQSAGVEVLVLDAQFRQALAAMRSLSHAGVAVGAVACASEAEWAPALRSRWCRLSAVVPDFDKDVDRYGDALVDLLDEYPTRLILPAHDGSLQALRKRRAELGRRTFLPLASEAALDIAVDKKKTLALAVDLGLAVPKSVLVSGPGDVRAALNEVGRPAVVKPVCSWAEHEGLGTRLGCDAVLTVDEAVRRVERIRAAGLRALIQQWLPGRRDAVSLFCTSGRIWVSFAQMSYREFPPMGGASVLCESLPPLADLIEPAEKLVRAMDLDGCSMVEFRRDAAGQPVLMEVNARMAGSVALAIASGVDFPRMAHAWALGKPLQEITSYQVGRRQRWLSGDIWNLKYAFDGGNRPDVPSRRRAVATFLWDFVRRPSALDIFDATDLKPALVEFRYNVIKPILGRVRWPSTADSEEDYESKHG